MAKKPKIAKAIGKHLSAHAHAALLSANDGAPDFVSLVAGGPTTSSPNVCKVMVSLKPADGMPDIGRMASLTDADGGKHFLTFAENAADAKTAPGVYTLEWMVTGIPGTQFSVDVTGDITRETHRSGRIPSMGFTGAAFEIEAVVP